jgi:hypothetical protein
VNANCSIEEGNFLAHLVIQPVLEFLLVTGQVFLAHLVEQSQKAFESLHARIQVRLLFLELAQESVHGPDELFGQRLQLCANALHRVARLLWPLLPAYKQI